MASTRELLAFNFLPAAYMDASWWQAEWLPQELFERLRQNPRSHHRLSRFFLRQIGLSDAALDDESAAAKIALLPGPRLMRLVFLAGVTLLSPHISLVLRGRDRREISAKIGKTDYDFAIKRGRLLLQQARLKEAIAGVGLADYSLADQECRRLGVASLATALQDAPAPLVRRAQLKLPKALAEQQWQSLALKPDEFLRLFRLLDRQIPAT